MTYKGWYALKPKQPTLQNLLTQSKQGYAVLLVTARTAIILSACDVPAKMTVSLAEQ